MFLFYNIIIFHSFKLFKLHLHNSLNYMTATHRKIYLKNGDKLEIKQDASSGSLDK